MTHLVKHRGPDGFGFAYFNADSEPACQCFHDEDGLPTFGAPQLGLGSRRLAILDLSASGNMPMQIEDGRFWITYNGEIYNYIELRSALESLGCKFRTGTDTEVILRAYERWGTNCVNRFRGMWSFAIYDRPKRLLFCSRDRFGIKPFYYFASSALFVFGSEIKQILEYPGVPRSINEAIAFHYLEQGLHDHTDETFFQGIRQLAAGHSLRILCADGICSIQLEKYWELPVTDGAGQHDSVHEKEHVDRFRELFRQSIRRHLRSDVPVGSCLSGGLDSSSIVAVASAESENRPIHSFSSCFEQASIDERPFIREVVSFTQLLPHLVFPASEGFWNDLRCLIWHQDEPVSSTSVYAQWCVMRSARQTGISVLLDGQGGDEILCGYRKFYIFHLWHMLRSADPRVFSEAHSWFSSVGTRSWSWKHATRYIPTFHGRQRSAIQRLCNPDFIKHAQNYPAVSIGPGQSLRERQKDDLARYSLPALLHYEDRNSMAHSVESRVPMLDHELATFAVNCRPNFKLRNGRTKWILREALKGLLPETVRMRKTKLGFETPQHEWLTADACGTIRRMLERDELAAGRILSKHKIREEFRKLSDQRPYALTDIELFRALNLELWAQSFNAS